MTETERGRRPTDASTRRPFERLPLWARLLAALPFPFWYAFSSTCAWLGEHVFRYRRQVVDMQIRKCFPEFDEAQLERTRRGFYRNFMDVMVESIKALTMTGEELDRRVELVGIERVRAQIEAGHSVIVATSHVCNWEWALQSISRHLGQPMDAAYKPLHNEWADRLFLTLRSRFGANMIPDRRVLMHILRRRRQPRALAMVADQDPTLAAVRHTTRFFGHETNFFMGPEAIARAAQCAVMYVAIERTRRGHYRVELEPLVAAGEELPAGGIIDRFAARSEAQIRAHPSDWLWAYRRWKKRRASRPAPAEAGDAQ
jgi:KDO2-lipid IV(A) lauroyltransferase